MQKTRTAIYLAFFTAFLISFAVTSVQAQSPAPPTYDWVVLHPSKQQLQILIQEGLIPDHIHSEHGEIAGAYRREELVRIQDLGIPAVVEVQDLATFYEERLALPSTQKTQATATTPSAFNYGSMGGYLTFDEVLAELDSMALNYPNLVTVRDSIGFTHEGRAVWMVKISDNPNVDETEPEAFYCGLHHAREPMSMTNLIYFMQYILENYGSDPLATYIIDNREMYFVPVINPDGYIYNQTTNPNGGGLWRKNRRVNGGGEFGVDLNRNYGYQFGFDNIGSSTDPASDLYRGPSGFSEPETQAIRDLCLAHDFKTAFCYHSFGDLLIRPFGFDPMAPVPDLNRYIQMGDQLVESNNYFLGTSLQTVGYAANGVSDDWLYGEQTVKDKIFSFTPEVGPGSDGFWPPQNQIIPLADANLEANIRLALMAGDYIATDPDPYPEVATTNIFLPVDFDNVGLLSAAPFTAEFILTDPNITATSGPISIASLAAGAGTRDSFALTLAPGLPDGTELCGVVRTTTAGNLVTDDTICFNFGIRQQIFSDTASNSPFQWNGGWAITTEKAYSGLQSITDSPNNNYPDNTTNVLTTLAPIDLTNFNSPLLQFRATWEVETGWDYVQVMASANGGPYQPLSGIHTSLGSGFSQPNNEPLYDGVETNWVLEDIDLSAYAGQTIQIRFQLVADGFINLDGFYFDDLEVRGYPTVGTDADLDPSTSAAFLHPNPSEGAFRLFTGAGLQGQALQVEITDLSGRMLHRQEVSHQGAVDLSHLSAGIYLSTVSAAGQRLSSQKIAIR